MLDRRWYWINHFAEQINDKKVCHFLVQVKSTSTIKTAGITAFFTHGSNKKNLEEL